MDTLYLLASKHTAPSITYAEAARVGKSINLLEPGFLATPDDIF